MTQSSNYNQLNSRVIEFVSNSYRSYFENLLQLQKQAWQATNSMTGGQNYYTTMSRQVVKMVQDQSARMQQAGQELNNYGLNLLQDSAQAVIKPVITMLNINEKMEELAARVDNTVELSKRINQLEKEKTHLEDENTRLAARLETSRAEARQVKTLAAEKAELESEQARLERANTRLEHKVENISARAEQAGQLENDLARAESERVRLERANTRLEHKLEDSSPAGTDKPANTDKPASTPSKAASVKPEAKDKETAPENKK